jgi:hypothetical protein
VAGSVALCFAVFCASRSGTWQARLLYMEKSLHNAPVASGSAILALPLIVSHEFDTTASCAPASLLKKALSSTKARMRVLVKDDFEEYFFRKQGRRVPGKFYSAFIHNDVLALHNLDTVWNTIPAGYVVAVRITDGVRINTFDAVVKRKASIEGELWRTDTGEVIWRAKSSGYIMNSEADDPEFIKRGVHELFTVLPDFIAYGDEDAW